MLKTTTTRSPALDQAKLDQIKQDWEFAEVWLDPMLFPPYVLLVLSYSSSGVSVYDPAQNYKIIFTGNTYDEVKTWLAEDEYEPISGRLMAADR